MMRSRLYVLSLVALLCPVAFAAADFLDAQALHDAGLVKFWQLQIPLESDQQLRDVFLVDDTLYLGTQDGYVFSVDALTGVLRWTRPITRSGYHVRRPAHAGENVLFVTPVDLQVYDRRTGEPRSRKDLRFPASSGAVTDDQRIYIAGLDARLYAFDLNSQMVDWRLFVGDAIQANPVIFGERIFLATERGRIYATTRANKAFFWEASTLGPVTADMVVDDAGVYVACRDQSLYLFDLGYGQVRWRVRFAGPLYDTPLVTADTAYQYCPAGGLAAVTTAITGDIDERIRWKLAEGRQAISADSQFVYVLSKDDSLLVVNVKDGKVAHTIPANGLTLGIPAKDATLFLAAPDGRLFCARPSSVPFLRQDDVLKALRPEQTGNVDAATSQPTTKPAAEAEDYLKSRRPGPPAGGKSKVSKGYEKGESGE